MQHHFHLLKTMAVRTDTCTVTYRYQKDGSESVVTLDGESLPEKLPEHNLLMLALDHGISIATACGGQGSCHLCNVQILEGMAGLNPPEDDELAMLQGAQGNIRVLRLACQSHPDGSQDIVVLIPEDPFKIL